MPDELFLVFQDCYKCGTKERWAWRQEQKAKDEGIILAKVPFYANGADLVIKEAAKAGFSLPFITDKQGHYGYSVVEVLEEIKEAEAKRQAKKTKRKGRKKAEKKEVEHGDTE